MPFGDQRSDFPIFVNMLHDLMESGGDDGVTMNPRSSQQQIVRSVGVNHIARHFRSQVPNLTLEFDLPHWARTIGIETIDSGLGGAQSVSGDPQVLHDPVRHNAQRGSWIYLNVAHFRRSNIPCEVQGSIMFPIYLYVVWREGDAGGMLRGMEAAFFVFLLWSSWDLGHEDLSSS